MHVSAEVMRVRLVSKCSSEEGGEDEVCMCCLNIGFTFAQLTAQVERSFDRYSREDFRLEYVTAFGNEYFYDDKTLSSVVMSHQYEQQQAKQRQGTPAGSSSREHDEPFTVEVGAPLGYDVSYMVGRQVLNICGVPIANLTLRAPLHLPHRC